MASSSTPTLPYTEAEARLAHIQWNASCGHHSLAAATGKPLETIRHACPHHKGWMNPTNITSTLKALQIPCDLFRMAGIDTSVHEGRDAILHLLKDHPAAILRIQFEGTWLNPGVPSGAAYQRTHYIALLQDHIMDTMRDPNVLLTYEQWLGLQHEHVAQVKNATGWHFTHAWIITSNLCGVPTSAV